MKKLDYIQFQKPVEYLALTDNNKDDLTNSTSGGAFMVLARPIIENGGIVFGSKLDNKGNCYQTYASTYDELKQFQGSKYVWSKNNNSYKKCHEFLNKGKCVLYSGTPCLIAGLYAYLSKNNNEKLMNNLITVDVFCHGTPLEQFFKLYLSWLRKKLKADGEIINYKFRTKASGWKAGTASVDYKKANKIKTKLIQPIDNPYYTAFIRSNCLQNKCYECKYSSNYRISNFSIGDFWGIEKSHNEFFKLHQNEGISCVLINNIKAKEYFEKFCKNKCDYIVSTYQKCKQCSIDKENNTVTNAGKNLINERSLINNAIQQKDIETLFDDILKIQLSKKFYTKCKQCISRIIPNKIKRIIKG